MYPNEPALQVGDLVMLRREAALPPHCQIEPGTVGRVLFLDDAAAAPVTVQFVTWNRPVRLRRQDLTGCLGSARVSSGQEASRGAQPLQAGDRVGILAVAEPPRGQPAAPPRYGRVLESEDENGRVAVQVPGRQHPLHLSVAQLRRVDVDARWAT